MYEELVKSLRETDFRDGCPCGAEHLCQLYADNNKDCVIFQAADAIEELSMKFHGDEAAIAGMKREIERMVVAGTPCWIPATERLPKYGDWVLGIGPKHGYHICEYRGITHFPYSGDSPWFSAKGRSLTITHWMPLPEPPKEET